jgi:hypothetical protein
MLLAALCVVPVAAQQTGQARPVAPSSTLAAPKARKLVLTDGSFHRVRTYERVGDRVRFYSTERSAWEEIPASMVDWAATKQAELEGQDKEKAIEEKIKEIHTTQLAEQVDVDASLEVAPGIFLPDGPGLFVFEGTATRALGQASADVKQNKGRRLAQIFSPIPIVPSQHKVEIKGARAALRLTTPHPEFYIRTADGHEPELELIRVKPRKDVREVEKTSTYFTGEKSRNREAISVERWQIAKGVFRITMSQSLEPGEYVLAEIVLNEEEPNAGVSLLVWDFGIDPPPSAARR